MGALLDELSDKSDDDEAPSHPHPTSNGQNVARHAISSNSHGSEIEQVLSEACVIG